MDMISHQLASMSVAPRASSSRDTNSVTGHHGHCPEPNVSKSRGTVNVIGGSDTPLLDINETDSVLHVGDRVIYIDSRNNDATEYGTVKWLGDLSAYDHSHSMHTHMAGVQFDNRIGGGTGLFGGQQVFVAAEGHASFVPVVGLYKAPANSIPEPAPATVSTAESCTSTPAPPGAVSALRKTSRRSRVVDFAAPPPSRVPSQTNDTTNRNNIALLQSIEDTPATVNFPIDSCVELQMDGDEKSYGVVRHVCSAEESGLVTDDVLLGIELENDVPFGWKESTDGSYNGHHLFDCAPRRAVFVLQTFVESDKRFTTPVLTDLGELDSGVVDEYVSPPNTMQMLANTGRHKGIQGHKNSCYLDTALFVMFAHSTAFDHLLLRACRPCDNAYYNTLVDILAHEIVYPLRKFGYVRADHVAALRELIANALPNLTGFVTEERDPEELFTALFERLLCPKPYITLRQNGVQEHSHLCTLVQQEWSSPLQPTDIPDVQFLLERSYTESALSFHKMPNVLIVQLPRSGPDRAYKYIAPNHTLNISQLMHNRPRQCVNHGRGHAGCLGMATHFCNECYMTTAHYLLQASFCRACFHKVHEKLDHVPSDIPIDRHIQDTQVARRLPLVPSELTLTGVLCIESSHYVAFARSHQHWLFYDSFAELLVPETRVCDDVGPYLTMDGHEQVRAHVVSEQSSDLPNNALRLFKDAYFCVYVAPDAHLFL